MLVNILIVIELFSFGTNDYDNFRELCRERSEHILHELNISRKLPITVQCLGDFTKKENVKVTVTI